MKFKLEIECDNAAFDENPCIEVARILRETASRLADGDQPDNRLLYDVNGNKCGSADFSHK